MAKLHHLDRQQFLPIPIREAWEFFSSAANLARITPKEMGFVIRPPLPQGSIHRGQKIIYTIRPLLGIPLTWVTEITEVDDPVSFVDTQLKGPYAIWRHRHNFEAVPGGTLMKDHVEYALPLGPLGELAHLAFVRKQLLGIFDFRERTLEQLFRKAP